MIPVYMITMILLLSLRPQCIFISSYKFKQGIILSDTAPKKCIQRFTPLGCLHPSTKKNQSRIWAPIDVSTQKYLLTIGYLQCYWQ